MRKPILVVLGHYQDTFAGFKANVDLLEPEISKILIRDGDKILRPIYPHWSCVDGTQPFNYSRNVNLGWKVTGNADVLLCGDDIRFDTAFVDVLQQTAYSDPTIGISVPELHGHSPFVCGYFKRTMLDIVGEMDERLSGYGYQDNLFCDKMARAGFRTQPTYEVKARHSGGTTFFRRAAEGGESVQSQCDRMRELYEKIKQEEGL